MSLQYLQRGLVRPLGRLQLALPDGDGRLGGLGQPGFPVVARRLGRRDRLLDVGHRVAGPARPRRRLADHPQRGRYREVVAAGPAQLQALGRAAHQRVVVLQVERDLGADRQGPPAHRRGHLRVGQDEEPVQPGGRLAGVAVRQPHVAQPDAQPQALVRVAVRQRRLQRDAEVAVLGDAPAEHLPAHRPGRLAAVEHRGDRLLHQRQDAVPVPQRQRAGLPGGLQPLGGVLPDRVQQPVPGVARRLAVQHHQRLVDQRDEQPEHRVGPDGLVRAHLLGHVQVPAGEGRQPPQQHLLVGVQQLEAPVHGGPQRLLPQRRGPVAGVEQLEPVPQPVGDLLHRQRPDPGRGQLDAQRDAVQRPAQPRHRRRVLRRQREPRPGPRGPRREQPDRLVRRQLGAAGAVRRQVKRRHPPHRLAPHPQRLPAGRDDPQPRAPGQQQLHQRGAVADLVLAGIQDQQHVPRAQRLGQRLRQRDPLLLTDPQGGGHRLRDRAVPVGQLDQPRLVQVARPLVRVLAGEHVAGQPYREPRLADTAQAAERQRADLAQQPGQLGQVTLAADEAVRLRWQVAGEYRGSGLHGPSGSLTLEFGND